MQWRNNSGQYSPKPSLKKRMIPLAMLITSASFCAWLSNPLVPTHIYGQNPVDLSIKFKSPIVINMTKLQWQAPEPELISPIPTEVYAKEATESAQPTPPPDPYRVPAGFPAPATELQKRVVKTIREVWGEDADTGIKLAFCESGYGSNVENQVSSARGVFQFIKSTWITERKRMDRPTDLALRFDIQENIETGFSHFKRNGLEQPWQESLKCMATNHTEGK